MFKSSANFTINTSDSIPFAYTVKKLNSALDFPKESDYEPFFSKLAKFNIPVEYKVAEQDSKNHLHYHGIMYLKKGFFRKRLVVKGIHLKLDEVYDRAGWLKYISKDFAVTSPQNFEEDDETSDADTEISMGEPMPTITYNMFKKDNPQ